MRDTRFVLDPFAPAYADLTAEELSAREDWAAGALRHCAACPRACDVNRVAGETGFCQIGRYARVASAFAHFGEEDCLRGHRGSGTIFFSACNLRCVFCQNDDISHHRAGLEYPPDLLADLMIEIEGMGCHNINFVTPEHVAPQVIEATVEAIRRGLSVPIVYNTSAFDSVDTLRQFEGLVDIYMPDFKIWEPDTAARLCQAADYPDKACAAILEMHRQVGDLRFGPDGIARRGLLVRHLVMPGLRSESGAILDWLARAVSRDTFVNIMRQYRPANRVGEEEAFAEINRRPTPAEFRAAVAAARAAGLWRLA